MTNPVWQAPPLPLLSEVLSLHEFLASSLDDVLEDAVKLLWIWALYRLFRAAGDWWYAGSAGARTRSRSPAQRLLARCRKRVAVAAAVVISLLTYPAVNEVADAAGNFGQILQDRLADAMGVHKENAPPVADTPPKQPVCFAAAVIDDFTEDASKYVCVAAHAAVGGLIGSGAAASILSGRLSACGMPVPRLVAMVVYYVFVLGTPAGRYTQCNDWADELGDIAQNVSMPLLC